jgi:hypothetical protein
LGDAERGQSDAVVVAAAALRPITHTRR